MDNRERMKSFSLRRQALFLACSAVLLSATAWGDEHELHLANEFSYTFNDISGPGSSQSSLTDGNRFLDVLSIYGNGRFGEMDYNFNLGAKGTDDKRNDIQPFSLTNMQGRFTNKVHTLTIGDTFESFSQYALNTAVKGASYRFTGKNTALPELTLLYGVAYPRWDNIWAVQSVERQLYGGKIKQKISDELWVGFSGVQTADHNRVDGASLYNGNTFTLDWDYRPIPGLTVHGESSFSNYSQSPAIGLSQDSNGSAHRIEAIGDGDPSRVSIEYERVSPNYLTLAGSSTPDREKVKSKWRYKYSKNITVNLGFLWFHDNVDNQKSTRTDYYKPEIGASYKRLFGRQYAVGDMTYKVDVATGATESNNHYLNFAYRDRFGVLDSDTTFGMVFYNTNNVQRSREFSYNTALNSRHTVGMFVLKPTIYLGGWTANEELAIPQGNDQIYEYSAGVGVDIPTWKITSTLKAGQNYLDKSPGTDSQKTFGSLNVYCKPDSLARMQGMLFVRALINDFRYDPNSTGSLNFRENSLTLGMNMQY